MEKIVVGIDPEVVGFIIIKAREFDAKVAPADVMTSAGPADEDDQDGLIDFAGDSTRQEIKATIDRLNIEEQYNLVALMWLGRGTYSLDEWDEALAEAKGAHNEHTADYLLGTPLLPDYLEDGLSELGYSIEDLEFGHL